MKKALIVGCDGQDGTYLTEYLERKKYQVIGISRRGLHLRNQKRLQPVDILKTHQISKILSSHQPHEIYYLAAYHHSSQDRKDQLSELFDKSFGVHVQGLRNFLDSMIVHCPKARIFYAASSHIFGHPKTRVQDERTPIEPVCVYGITKAAGLQICRFYRNEFKLFASVGILYNHESPIRAAKFVSQKIVQAAIAIKQGRQRGLVLGNLNAVIDWGYAGDYVEAMHKILRAKAPDDLVIASGQSHTVKQFVEGVFDVLKLDWKKFVRQDARLIQTKHQSHWQGNPEKLKKLTGWKPKRNFNDLIALMVEAGLRNAK
ncbi:MAG: GDP-mannose 4,6-dehydratase [Candidatus Omnitrophica bacterium]|nr:GDP-mannose 4,6-dehydratase [Candidatus Omnitrophota bacterium]